MKNLLDSRALQFSPIVANSLMNRERNCSGGNSYRKELFFDILEYLPIRSSAQKQTAWLDLCCGSGKALIEAARIFSAKKSNFKIKIIGVDLVSMFAPFDPKLDFLNLSESPVENFNPDCDFDLITCVHGLHYIGDKLAVIHKSVSLLKPNGIFLANLDLANFKSADGTDAGRTIAAELRKNGIDYNSKKHLIICQGKREINFKFFYLGADDKAGANYTKQPVVDSYYGELF